MALRYSASALQRKRILPFISSDLRLSPFNAAAHNSRRPTTTILFMRNEMHARAAIAVNLFLLVAQPLFAQDWPQWRGPHRDGKVTGFLPPSKWPATLTQKWTTPVGRGDSSPVLAGGKLYAFGRMDADEVVSCLDAATGKVLWQSKYPANFVVTGPAARHPGTRSTPAFADGKLCTLGVGGILSCFDADTGVVLWRKQSTNDYLGIPFRSDSSMSPLIEGGRCFVHIGGKTNAAMFAFDLASGEVKWKWDGEGPANSSPVVLTAGGKKQLVTLTAKHVVGLTLEDGKLLWEIPFEAAQGNNTTPVVDDATVYYIGQGKGLFAVKIEEQAGKVAAVPLWTNRQHASRFTAPILRDGALYGYDNGLFCASARTGATLWTDPTKRGQSAALLDLGPVLLTLTLNGELTLFKPGEAEFAQVANYKVASTETWAHPVVTTTGIFIRDSETLSLWSLE
jgi:outer membrane protein assembly factor BamB